jgi:hypothetical protein
MIWERENNMHSPGGYKWIQPFGNQFANFLPRTFVRHKYKTESFIDILLPMFLFNYLIKQFLIKAYEIYFMN